MVINASTVPLPIGPLATSAAPSGNAPDADALEQRFAAAIADFAAGHWQHAFTELITLGNQGHAPAARIASMLVQRGTATLGGPFHADSGDQARWQKVAGEAGAANAWGSSEAWSHR